MAGRRSEGEGGSPSPTGFDEKSIGHVARESLAASGPYALLSLTAFWAGDFTALDELLVSAPATVGPGPWPDEIAA